jgi:DNA-binding transcriptional MerR regulator
VRISELARRTDLPVGTIKYYLREGLLPPGTLTSTTQASYDAEHVRRLGLIRVLIGVGGLSIARARAVLAAIDSPPRPGIPHDLLGTAHAAIGPEVPAGEEALARARALVARWGWADVEKAPALSQLAAALEGIEAADVPLSDATLDRYAALMARVAEVDLASVPTGSPAEAVRFVVAGTVLFEPMLLAMRRLAQWGASVERFGPGGAS